MEPSRQFRHPNINMYRDGGANEAFSGDRGDGSGNLVGLVPTHLLLGMPYNHVDRKGVEFHKQALRDGKGFTDPIMVEYNHHTGMAVVGEGNHRLQAAYELGISHVPARVARSPYLRSEPDNERGYRPKHIGVVPSRYKGGLGEPYYPPQMHPAWLWGDAVKDFKDFE